MEFISFLTKGDPKPQGSKTAFKRGQKIVLVETSKGLPGYRDALINDFTREKQATGWETVQKPDAVVVNIEFRFARPKTNKNTWHIVKPDLDKLTRSVLDCLTKAAIIEDDSQVFRVVANKSYTPQDAHTITTVQRIHD